MERGTRVGQAYVALVVDGDHVNESIVDSVDEAGPGVEKAGEDHGERYNEKFDEGFFKRLRTKFLPRIHKELGDKMDAEGEVAGKAAGEKITTGLKNALSDNSEVDRLGDRLGAHVGGHMVDAINHALTSGDFDGNALKKLFDRLMSNSVSGNRGGGAIEPDKTLGDRIGNIFGSGSRNNAIIPLQLTAKAAGGVLNAIERVTKGVKSLFDKTAQGAEETVSLTEKLTVNVGEFGAMIGKGFAAVASGAVAIGVVTVAASILVSVLSALVAIVAALASTIVSALVAAAAVGAAGLLAMGAAAGLATIAFTSMTDAQRKVLTTSFRPLKEELTGLGQLMLHDIVPAFHIWADNIQRALTLLGPLAQVMGGALARAGTIFTGALSGPGFQMFIRQLGVDLPRITTNLSTAFGNLLNGLLALFTPVLPLVRTFSRYLAEVTGRFEKWAASARGQNQISSFVDRALNSLKSLWNFLHQVGGLITDVLFSASGQRTGNSIFDDMANAVRHFRTTITTANLEKWFKDGARLAKSLGDAIKGLADAFNALNSSGVVGAVSKTLTGFGKGLSTALKVSNYLPNLRWIGSGISAVNKAIGDNPIPDMINKITAAAAPANVNLKEMVGNLFGVANMAGGLPVVFDGAANSVSNFARQVYIAAAAAVSATNPLLSLLALSNIPSAAPSASDLQNSGSNALSNTSKSHGGTKPPKAPAQFHNPFLGIANAILNSGPSISAQIKNAMLSVNKQIANALASIDSAASVQSANSGINSLVQSVTSSMQQTVNTARDAVQSAAQTLASASNLKAAKRALAELRARQRDLHTALADQRKLKAEIAVLNAQKSLHSSLIDGFKALIGDGGADSLAEAGKLLKASNLTLADFAKMRSLLADAIQKANQKLQDAISLRDNYKTQVSDSIKSFAALTTAQAQVINGVTQALSSNDIISNLQDKLKQIQDFQTNLNLLLAMGLSNDAYKQIVDAGVEAGSAYAQALVQGGSGAVDQVNGLVQSTNDIADKLGSQASSRLYQAGVDAAQGLVDGLTSLSAQLDSAATRLGNSIANAVKRALGIKSPSRVLRAMMGYVGDGIALGLDDQQPKVARAAGSLSSRIAVSPEVASYAARQSGDPVVSGNHNEHHWHVNTPTTDPVAVAQEAINEMTGRLP